MGESGKKPKIILLAGFLGSGKTSLLLETIKNVAKSDRKCGIIVNEIGDIGIDNRFLKKLGYDIWDLFGGCVCCTLKVTLQATVYKLTEEYDLDYIIFEPTGMADPLQLYPPIYDCGYKDEDILTAFIFDALRIDLYKERFSKLFQDYLKIAHSVFISKVDLVDAETIHEARKMITDINPNLQITEINLNEEITEANLLQVLGEADVTN